MMLLVRPSDPKDTSFAAEYFQNRKRQFELQFQFRFRQKPSGNIYYGVHLDHDPNLGIARRLFVYAVFSFIQSRWKNSFHFALRRQGDEKAHMSFDMERSGFNIVVTHQGQTPPPLGQFIPIDRNTKDKMKKHQRIDWNTDDTYTLSCFNMHADFSRWAFVQFPIPGLADRGMERVIGPQHLGLRVYATFDQNAKHHNESEVKTLLDLELSHTKKTHLGPHAKAWKQLHDKN